MSKLQQLIFPLPIDGAQTQELQVLNVLALQLCYWMIIARRDFGCFTSMTLCVLMLTEKSNDVLIKRADKK